MRMRPLLIILLALILAVSPVALAAEVSGAVEITTVEELLAMESSGNYILMNDLDMVGIDWKPLDFSGSFDGNGHAILNLTLSELGKTTSTTWDGNRKEYETVFAGLFGVVKDAQIMNLKLLNVRGVVESNSPCFVGGLAGYAENCTITGCTVTGSLELRAHDRMFGLGGAVGYGSGSLEGCELDVTLICVDTDTASSDEQFLGGVYAAGFMDVKNCDVTIDGYVSEHGYAHNGGIVGMFAEYPLGEGQSGYIKNNHVAGKITFFEDSAKRRAYCEAYVGEAMVNRYYLDGNTESFRRDERTDYSVELRPEMCASPSYTEAVVSGSCEVYGYTSYTCSGCGYSYTDHYTLHAHTVTNWTVIEEPTEEKDGLSEGSCDKCGETVLRTELLQQPTEPVETTAPVQETEKRIEVAEETKGEEQGKDNLFCIAVALDAALLLTALFLWRKIRKIRKKARYRRK